MSWKEIAVYLGKGVRTVQRWEQLFGLPVRRPGDQIKGPVQVTRQELDRWLNERWSHRQRKANHTCRQLADEQINAVRGNIQHSAELRKEIRLLVQEMRACSSSIVKECEQLAKTMIDTPMGRRPPKAE